MVILISLLMQRRGYNNGILIPAISMLFLSDFLFLFSGCRTGIGDNEKSPFDMNKGKVAGVEVNPDYVKFRSYQNLDSTSGYTIFLNSKPYMHYYTIPFLKKGSGFPIKKDADIVAGMIVK